MRNKPSDVLYCGVDKDKIEKSSPKLNKSNAKYLYRYIIDRYTAHINKDIKKLDAPWTDNRIVAEHRFTNVKRELDKQTKWAIENIANNEKLSYKDKLLNMILFRLFSKYETMELIQAPYTFKNADLEVITTAARENIARKMRQEPDYKFFTTAFFTNGVKGTLSNLMGTHLFPLAVVKYVCMLSQDNDFKKIRLCKTQEDVYKFIRNMPAMGDFMAYQVFVDFTYIPEFPFSENEFTVAGVGAKKGLEYLFDDFDELNYEEALFWLRDNIESCMDELYPDSDTPFGTQLMNLMVDVPKEDRNMNVMSLENCMCELGKYCDIVYKVGRPRPKYKGV